MTTAQSTSKIVFWTGNQIETRLLASAKATTFPRLLQIKLRPQLTGPAQAPFSMPSPAPVNLPANIMPFWFL